MPLLFGRTRGSVAAENLAKMADTDAPKDKTAIASKTDDTEAKEETAEVEVIQVVARLLSGRKLTKLKQPTK